MCSPISRVHTSQKADVRSNTPGLPSTWKLPKNPHSLAWPPPLDRSRIRGETGLITKRLPVSPLSGCSFRLVLVAGRLLVKLYSAGRVQKRCMVATGHRSRSGPSQRDSISEMRLIRWIDTPQIHVLTASRTSYLANVFSSGWYSKIVSHSNLSYSNKGGNGIKFMQNNQIHRPRDLEFQARFTGQMWEEAAQAEVTQVANVT